MQAKVQELTNKLAAAEARYDALYEAYCQGKVPEGVLADAKRYNWVLHQGVLTDAIFAYTKSRQRHVNNAIDDAISTTTGSPA